MHGIGSFFIQVDIVEKNQVHKIKENHWMPDENNLCTPHS
jgi:hypothetical protein